VAGAAGALLTIPLQPVTEVGCKGMGGTASASAKYQSVASRAIPLATTLDSSMQVCTRLLFIAIALVAFCVLAYAVTPLTALSSPMAIQEPLSESQAIAIAEQSVGGNAISLSYRKDKNDLQYHIRVARDLHTFDVKVNSVSGAFVSSQAN
jgi:uncharacterized membrane protein YkoI